jgi:hypothetical protein
MPRALIVVFIAWVLTLPAVFVVAWLNVQACLASTPEDDCSIVYLVPAGWLLPWVIGVGVLAFGLAVFSRRPRA